MWRVLGLVGLLGLCACDRVFGLEGHAPPDAPATVTGHYVRQIIHNDATHMPTHDEQPLSNPDVTLTARGPGSSQVAVPVATDGSFTFEAGSPYALSITVTSAPTFELQSSAPELELVDQWLGRVDRTPVTLPTDLSLMVTNVPVQSLPVIQSTGLWADLALFTASDPTSVSLDWRQVTDSRGVPSLLDASKFDRLYVMFDVLQMDGAGVSYYQLASFATDDAVTQSDGVSGTVTMAAQQNNNGQCTHLMASELTESKRLVAADLTLAPYGGQWQVLPAPPLAYGLDGVAPIASANTMTDVDTDIAYGNPFPGTTVYGVLLAQGTRNIQLGTAKQLPVYGTSLELALVGGGMTGICPPTALGGHVAVPAEPTVAGHALADDNTQIVIDRSADVPIGLSLAAPGQSDYYGLDLYQLGNTGGQTALTLLRSYVTTVSTVRIDPTLLVANTTYMVMVTNNAGHAHAVDGDFVTISFPRGFAALPSRTFVITN